MLKGHFGEDIYESGMYNKNAKPIYFPWLYKDFDKTKVNDLLSIMKRKLFNIFYIKT